MNFIQKFLPAFFALIVISFSSAYAVITWKNLPPMIRLPSLETDEQILEFLNSIQVEYPGIFENASNANIDLVQLVKDNKRLIEGLLKQFPNYESFFQNRKLLNLRIDPPAEGVRTTSSRISTGAVWAWKRQLGEVYQNLDKNQNISQEIASHFLRNLPVLEKKYQYEKDKETLTKDYTSLLELGKNTEWTPFFVSKVNSEKQIDKKLKVLQEELQLRLNKEGLSYEKKSKLNELLVKADKTIVLFDVFQDKYKKYLQKEFNQAVEIEKEQNALAQLYFIFKRKIQDLETLSQADYGKVFQAQQEISDDDLAYFSDREAIDEYSSLFFKFLRQKGKISEFQEFEVNFNQLLAKDLKTYTRQVREYTVEVKKPVLLKEIPPWLAILRGLIAGDCGTAQSFPYPNDPHEKTFLILDAEKSSKGIVTVTEVEVSSPQSSIRQKALYVVTVSGRRVTAADTEIIFRGLEKEKVKLGVQDIVLPSKKNILELINYSDIRGVYQHHIENSLLSKEFQNLQGKKKIELQNQSVSKIHYLNPDIRSYIEQFPSKYNGGQYDHMDRNDNGVIFRADSNQEKIKTEITTNETELIQPRSLTLKEMVLFTLNEYAADRYELANLLLNTQPLSEGENPENFKKIIRLIENQGPPGSKKVAEFEAEVKQALLQFGFNASDFDQKDNLFFQGRMRSPDAFSDLNIDRTAKLLVQKLKHHLDDSKVWSLVQKNKAALLKTKSFQNFLKKLDDQLHGKNEMRAIQAAFLILTKFFPESGPLNKSHLLALKLANPFFQMIPIDMVLDLRLKTFAHPELASPKFYEDHKALDKIIRLMLSNKSVSLNQISVLLALQNLKHTPLSQEFEEIQNEALKGIKNLISETRSGRGSIIDSRVLIQTRSEILKSSEDVPDSDLIVEFIDEQIVDYIRGKDPLDQKYLLLRKMKDSEFKEKLEKIFFDQFQSQFEKQLNDPEVFDEGLEKLLYQSKSIPKYKPYYDRLRGANLSLKNCKKAFSNFLFWIALGEEAAVELENARKAIVRCVETEEDLLSISLFYSSLLKTNSELKDKMETLRLLDRQFDRLLQRTMTLRDWSQLSVWVDNLATDRESNVKKLKSRLRVILSNPHLPNADIAIFRSELTQLNILDFWSKEFPELNHLLSLDTPRQRKEFLEQIYPMQECTADDIRLYERYLEFFRKNENSKNCTQ